MLNIVFRFAGNKDKILDLCCGRGGDLMKFYF